LALLPGLLDKRGLILASDGSVPNVRNSTLVIKNATVERKLHQLTNKNVTQIMVITVATLATAKLSVKQKTAMNLFAVCAIDFYHKRLSTSAKSVSASKPSREKLRTWRLSLAMTKWSFSVTLFSLDMVRMTFGSTKAKNTCGLLNKRKGKIISSQ
jgi:hypothetical protein